MGKYYKTRYMTPRWRLISTTVAQHSVAFFVIVIRKIYHSGLENTGRPVECWIGNLQKGVFENFDDFCQRFFNFLLDLSQQNPKKRCLCRKRVLDNLKKQNPLNLDNDFTLG